MPIARRAEGSIWRSPTSARRSSRTSKGRSNVYSLQVGVPAQAKPAIEAKPPEPRRRWRLTLGLLAAGYALLLALVGGGAWYFINANRSAVVAAAAIAVLPFDNLGGDEQSSRLADGMTEDVITDLARYRHLLVIARNSTMTYRRQARRRAAGRQGSQRRLCPGGLHSASSRPAAGDGGAHRRCHRRTAVVGALGPASPGYVLRAGRGGRQGRGFARRKWRLKPRGDPKPPAVGSQAARPSKSFSLPLLVARP